jgi:hypothetical protein
MLEFTDLLKAWVVVLGVAVIHTVFLAVRVGSLRTKLKSWATEEGASLSPAGCSAPSDRCVLGRADKAKNGGEGTVGEVPEVARAIAVHRNMLENLPLFIGACESTLPALPSALLLLVSLSSFLLTLCVCVMRCAAIIFVFTATSVASKNALNGNSPTDRDYVAGIILFVVWCVPSASMSLVLPSAYASAFCLSRWC